jgi:hypothetical protein
MHLKGDNFYTLFNSNSIQLFYLTAVHYIVHVIQDKLKATSLRYLRRYFKQYKDFSSELRQHNIGQKGDYLNAFTQITLVVAVKRFCTLFMYCNDFFFLLLKLVLFLCLD